MSNRFDIRIFAVLVVIITVGLVVPGCADGFEGPVDGVGVSASAELELPVEDGLAVELDLADGQHLDVFPAVAKADTVSGYQGPLLSGLSANTAVWEVQHAWSDVDASGKDWNDKYAEWIDSLDPTLGFDGYTTTFELTTPWGRTVPAPSLECAETAMFLRAAYAAWHGLPFYLAAWSAAEGAPIYFGHFGIVKSDGSGVSGYPKFATWYDDYTDSHGELSTSELLANWPSDSNLAGKSLTSAKDDAVPFLGAEAWAGAYFDHVFLNKRVGQFLMRMLTNVGSMHLVDSNRNTFNVTAEAVRAGDVLLQRWQDQGIGHTVQVMRANEIGPSTMEVEVVFGSMPRIQPKWKTPNLAKSYFTSPYSGGPEANAYGETYVSLGGGLKRWRTAVIEAGRWRNVVPASDVASWIDSTDLSALGARTAQFDTLLGQLSADEKQDVLLTQIAEARSELEKRPASCSNRRKREEAFAELVTLNQTWFDMTPEQTDKQFRVYADYVFAELEYDQSKTCCWNSSTSAMYEIIMSYNEAMAADPVTGTCNEPVVFKAVDGGYDVFADYAAEIGQGSAWVAWSADETCPQAGVQNDTEVDHDWTPWCELQDVQEPPTDDGNDGGGNDDGGGNNDGGWVEDTVEDSVDSGWGCHATGAPAETSGALLLWLLGLAVLATRRRRSA